MDWANVRQGTKVYRVIPDDYPVGRLYKVVRENGVITKAQVTFRHKDDPAKGQNRTVYINQISLAPPE